MNEILYKISLAVFPTVYYLLSRLWLSTCRQTVRGKENLDALQGKGGLILPVWHYSIIYLFHYFHGHGGVVLVSASRDGEYVARTAERFGLEAVRGSSNRYGAQALKKLLKAMKAGKNLGIVADGSQGPARIFQPGAIYLASKTGAPILPVACAVDRYKTFRSWDLTVLPMLFSRVVLQYGEPLTIPPDLDAEGIEEHRLRAEEAMNSIYGQVWAEFGRKNHDGGPGRTSKEKRTGSNEEAGK